MSIVYNCVWGFCCFVGFFLKGISPDKLRIIFFKEVVSYISKNCMNIYVENQDGFLISVFEGKHSRKSGLPFQFPKGILQFRYMSLPSCLQRFVFSVFTSILTC